MIFPEFLIKGKRFLKHFILDDPSDQVIPKVDVETVQLNSNDQLSVNPELVRKINLEPEAGFGLANVVPVSSAYPNALNPDGPTHMYMMDKEGQQTIFFTSTSAFDVRRMARARILNGSTVIEDRNYQIGGEDVTYILNGSRMSVCVQTSSGKVLVLNPLSSSNPEEWVLIANVTTIHSQTPSGMTGSLVQSSFHYSPEFNKIIRVAGSSSGEISFQIINASGVVLYQSLVFSLNSVINYTGGPSTTSVNPFGYTIGLHFSYSYSKKELVFQTGSYNFFAGSVRCARFKFAFNVPDAVWSGNFSGVTSQYSTYKYYVAGGANNGVLEVTGGATAADFSFCYSWDPFSNSYILGRIYYWPAELGDVDWTMINHTDTENFTYVPLPDATYIGKRVEADNLLLGSSFIHTFGASQLHGTQRIDIPYGGTLLVEGNLSFNTKVASIVPSSSGHVSFDATSGNRYSCDGLNQQLYSWTETSTGWTKTAVSGKFSPTSAPVGYTICGNKLLYVSQLNKFVGLFYKNSDTRKYAYLIAFDAVSFTVLSTSINTNEVDSYFAITNGGLNYVEYFVLALIDNHLFCAFTCSWPGGLTGLRVSAFSKANLLSLNPNVSPILSSKTYYPYYASFAIGKDASGNLYTAENVKWPNTRVLVTKYSSSDAYLASDVFVSSGPVSTNKTWLSVYTTASLALYVSTYPIFLGGYQCVLPQQNILLKPNCVSYLIATKTTDDRYTIQISVVDYLSAGNSAMFNSFNQVCLAEVVTDSEKVISKIDYTIRRDSQLLSKAGDVLAITRGNSVSLGIPTVPAAQTLGISGHTLSISSGNSVTLPDADNQTLSVSGNNLYISGGNGVTLPGSGFGYGQTWSHPTRYANTWYQNTTSKPIMVNIVFGSYGGGAFYVSPDGVTMYEGAYTLNDIHQTNQMSCVVPPGNFYRLQDNTQDGFWLELS